MNDLIAHGRRRLEYRVKATFNGGGLSPVVFYFAERDAAFARYTQMLYDIEQMGADVNLSLAQLQSWGGYKQLSNMPQPIDKKAMTAQP